MKADRYGTPAEQTRHRHGWITPTARRRGGDISPCWKCAHWTGGIEPRGLCRVLDLATTRNASCASFERRERRDQMIKPTLPNDIARCAGVGSDEDGWRRPGLCSGSGARNTSTAESPPTDGVFLCLPPWQTLRSMPGVGEYNRGPPRISPPPVDGF